jgi:hypothetical protein
MSGQSSQVPKQYYGYSLQCTECVSALLDADPGGVVSLEVFEDVGLQSVDGKTLALQTKAGTGANPVSDSSIELWKTFRNWIDQVRSRKIPPKNTRFELYVASKKKGKLCSEMSAAQSPEAVGKALESIKGSFLNKRNGKFKPSTGAQLRTILEAVLATENEKTLRVIIAAFRFRNGQGSSYDELKAKLEKGFIDLDIIDDVLLYGLGWVKKILDERIEKDLPAVVKVDEFRSQISTFRSKLKSREFLPSFAGIPSGAEIQSNKLSRYVRQLKFIEAEDEEIYEAITDFLTAKTNAIEYARRNLINRESLVELDGELKATWKNLRKKIQLEGNSKSDSHFGQLLANACLAHRAKLQGLEVPHRFTPGCFHNLADIPEIGWHPRYKQLLTESGK